MWQMRCLLSTMCASILGIGPHSLHWLDLFQLFSAVTKIGSQFEHTHTLDTLDSIWMEAGVCPAHFLEEGFFCRRELEGLERGMMVVTEERQVALAAVAAGV